MATAKKPDGAIVIRTIAALTKYVNAFTAGHLSLVIIVGRPGLQKSQMIRQAVGEKAVWFEGNATAFGMYCQLWRHRDKSVVIDDVDGLYRDKNGVRLLKCLCQTDPRKTLSWHSDAPTLARDGIDREFQTHSRVAIIANEWQTLNANIAAVEDRGHVLMFEPSALEVHKRTAEWFWDEEVFSFVAEHLHLIRKPSMRHYVLAAQLKKAGLNWRDSLIERWRSDFPATTFVVASLLSDPRFSSEGERIEAFKQTTGQGRSTYFYNKKKLLPTATPPCIKLKNHSSQTKETA